MLPESLQPFAKSVYPALATLVAVLVQFVVTGEYDRAELTTTLTGLGTAALAYLVTNRANDGGGVLAGSHGQEEHDMPVSAGLSGKAGEQR